MMYGVMKYVTMCAGHKAYLPEIHCHALIIKVCALQAYIWFGQFAHCGELLTSIATWGVRLITPFGEFNHHLENED
jgi:hypothetical protein